MIPPPSCVTPPCTDPNPIQIIRVAPPPSFYVGVLVLILIVAVWGYYIHQQLKNCTCTDKPEILKLNKRRIKK